jgi:endonuclease/exonuclease/phosphatase family metal-dependent hydrolase
LRARTNRACRSGDLASGGGEALRLASFNVENLFDRAVALNQESWAQGRPALDQTTQLNKMLNKATYTASDKARILELLEKLGLKKKDDAGEFALLRQDRGHLLKRTRQGVEVVATGRADWVGWVELKTEPVNGVATEHTAMVMRDVDADVQAVVEAEDRPALTKFVNILFKVIGATPYKHIMLIDGNDDRGIDVALMTKPGYEIVRIRSHVDDTDTDGLIFSRDCPEYTVATPTGKRLVVLVNHLKSKGFGGKASSDTRRARQAARVAEIYQGLSTDGEQHIAVVGDFNDFPGSPPLDALLAETDLKDISSHPHFDKGGREGTFGNCTPRDKIDYVLLSPALFAKATGGGIFRMGAWGGTKGTMWPHYPTLTRHVEAASDHCAIYADLNL